MDFADNRKADLCYSKVAPFMPIGLDFEMWIGNVREGKDMHTETADLIPTLV